MRHDHTYKGGNISLRLAVFGGRIVRLTTRFPDNKAGRYVADQLLRSATAPGAHYAEGRSAQSGKDFIHKVSLAAKEAREALHWILVAQAGELIEEELDELLDEANQLIAMLVASVRTAQKNLAG